VPPTSPPPSPLSGLIRAVASATVTSLAGPVSEGSVRNARDAVAADRARAHAYDDADRTLAWLSQSRRSGS
jgi:hypothetical protein